MAMHIANRKPALLCALTYFATPLNIRLQSLTCITCTQQECAVMAMHIADRKPALLCALTYFATLNIRLQSITCIKVHLNILRRATDAL